MQVDVEVKQWHGWQWCDTDKRNCKGCVWGVDDEKTQKSLEFSTILPRAWGRKSSLEIKNDFCWRALHALRPQSADDMWQLMGDGWRHFAAAPLGLEEQEASPASSENVKQPKQNVRAGNCEQTAERVAWWWCARFVEVRRVWMSEEGESVGSSPHAPDKSHLSGTSPYKTWDTTVATPHSCCCLLWWGTLPSCSYKAVIRTIKLTPSPLASPPLVL